MALRIFSWWYDKKRCLPTPASIDCPSMATVKHRRTTGISIPEPDDRGTRDININQANARTRGREPCTQGISISARDEKRSRNRNRFVIWTIGFSPSVSERRRLRVENKWRKTKKKTDPIGRIGFHPRSVFFCRTRVEPIWRKCDSWGIYTFMKL